MSYGGEQEEATQVQAQQGLKPMFVADGVIPLPRPLKGNGSITPAQPSRMDACFQYTTDQLRQVELRLDSLRDRLCPVLSQSNQAKQSDLGQGGAVSKIRAGGGPAFARIEPIAVVALGKGQSNGWPLVLGVSGSRQ